MQKHWCLSRISGHCNWWVWVMSNLFSVCSIQGHANNILFARAPRHATSHVKFPASNKAIFRCDCDVIHWQRQRTVTRDPRECSCRGQLSCVTLCVRARYCKSYLQAKSHNELWTRYTHGNCNTALIWVGIHLHLCELGGSFWSPPTSSLLSSSPSKV